MHNSAQELLKRGEKLFGPEEKDRKSSSRFLIILLDSIEKWSQIEVGDFALSKDKKSKEDGQAGVRASSSDDDENEDFEQKYLHESDYSFRKVHEDLVRKEVTFPSRFKKQVSNNLEQDDDIGDDEFDGISESRTDEDALSQSSDNFSSSCYS